MVVSSGTHKNVRTQGFPEEYCFVMKWSVYGIHLNCPWFECCGYIHIFLNLQSQIHWHMTHLSAVWPGDELQVPSFKVSDCERKLNFVIFITCWEWNREEKMLVSNWRHFHSPQFSVSSSSSHLLRAAPLPLAVGGSTVGVNSWHIQAHWGQLPGMRTELEGMTVMKKRRQETSLVQGTVANCGSQPMLKHVVN